MSKLTETKWEHNLYCPCRECEPIDNNLCHDCFGVGAWYDSNEEWVNCSNCKGRGYEKV